MKIIIAPDKFKGSLSSFEACDAIRQGLKRAGCELEMLIFPMADGGDGFAQVLQYYHHTETVEAPTIDPLHRPITATYQWNEQARTAIIETAAASGLVLLDDEERNPLVASTAGTGRLILHALQQGAEKIILGLGGSATNDAGTGILHELGFRFLDARGEELIPRGESLIDIADIKIPDPLPEIAFELAVDVQNPLYGPNGAAYVYAPQKGASADDVLLLDKGLRHFADVLKRISGREVAEIPGSGAAGGIAAGLMPFFDIKMKRGIDWVIDASGIDDHWITACLLITGEGKLDSQSGEGKVVGSLAALAAEHAVPAIAFCGVTDQSESACRKLGLAAAYVINDDPSKQQASMENAFEFLSAKAEAIFRSSAGRRFWRS